MSQKNSEKSAPVVVALGRSPARREQIDATRTETAEYLAQMAGELVTLAATARLARLSMLLDYVKREAEAEASTL
ncbi:hypothetical protein [Methylocella sp.]|uniref:hypothetical protein n=1 Tax=Methylocella sp. TaxID=1978226 RepID=UPI003783ACC2